MLQLHNQALRAIGSGLAIVQALIRNHPTIQAMWPSEYEVAVNNLKQRANDTAEEIVRNKGCVSARRGMQARGWPACSSGVEWCRCRILSPTHGTSCTSACSYTVANVHVGTLDKNVLLLESKGEYYHVQLNPATLKPTLPARVSYDLAVDNFGHTVADTTSHMVYETPLGYSARR